MNALPPVAGHGRSYRACRTFVALQQGDRMKLQVVAEQFVLLLLWLTALVTILGAGLIAWLLF